MALLALKQRLEAANRALRLPVVFAIALAVRLVWWAVAHFVGDFGFTTHDSTQYLRLAHNMLHFGEFSQSQAAPFYPDVVRTPGYPLWLVLFGWMSSSTAVIALVQSVLGAFVPMIVAKTAKALHLPWSGWAALILAFDAGLVVFTPLVLTDGLFTLLFAIWFHRMVTVRSGLGWMTTALLAGVLVLVRPSGLVLPIITVVWFIARMGLKPFAVLVAATAMLLPVGWMLRNYSTQNTFTLSTIGPNTLYLFHAAAVKAQGENRSFSAVQSEMIDDLNSRFDWSEDPQATSRFTTFCKQQSVRIYRNYPVEAAKVTASNLIAFIVKPPRGYFDDGLGLRKGYTTVSGFEADAGQSLLQRLLANTSPPALALTGYQFALQLLQIILFALGMRALWRSNRRLAVLIASLFVYFWFSSAITQTDARFRLPVLPLMGVCWAAVVEKRKSHPQGNEKP